MSQPTPWGLAAKAELIPHERIAVFSGGRVHIIDRADAPPDALANRGGWILTRAEVKRRPFHIYSLAPLSTENLAEAIATFGIDQRGK
jgi:hypothetical protein